MRYFAILISLCLVGCGALLEATDQDREKQIQRSRERLRADATRPCAMGAVPDGS
jgi:hypothetical protein